MAVKERRTKILLSLFLIADVDFPYLNLNEQLQKIFDLTLNQKGNDLRTDKRRGDRKKWYRK